MDDESNNTLINILIDNNFKPNLTKSYLFSNKNKENNSDYSNFRSKLE